MGFTFQFLGNPILDKSNSLYLSTRLKNRLAQLLLGAAMSSEYFNIERMGNTFLFCLPIWSQLIPLGIAGELSLLFHIREW